MLLYLSNFMCLKGKQLNEKMLTSSKRFNFKYESVYKQTNSRSVGCLSFGRIMSFHCFPKPINDHRSRKHKALSEHLSMETASLSRSILLHVCF